ncbi:E3 ubiquitin-protein ligase RAD18-like isoform X2 [Branchiostoma floridae x Branchiostoma belcheri]
MSSLCSSGDWPENFKQLKTIDDLLRCPICYEYFDITMIIPQCSHNYCSLCIRRYLNYKTQCPTCGVSVSEPELRNNRSLDDLVRQFLDVRPSLLQCVKSGVNSHTADRGSTSGPAGSKPDTSISGVKKITSSKAGKSSEAATTGVKKSPPTNTLDRFCSTVGTRTVPVEDDDHSDDFRDDVKRHRSKRISYKDSSSDDDVEIVGTVVTPPPVKPAKVPSPKASTSQESTPAGERNNSQVAMADCPVCGVSIPERHINNHLDVCLTREEKKESLRSSAPKRKPMAKLVYNLMSDKDLRKRLKEKGLSTQGDRQTLIARHHEFVLRYNSQCDSAEPKSVAQIVKEVEKHERVLSKTVTKPTFTLNKTSNEQERDRVNTKYATEHKAQFNSLIENARKRMKQKRKAKLAEEGPEITAEEKLPSLEVDLNIATDETSTERPTKVPNESEKTVEDSLTVQKGGHASTEEDQEGTVGKDLEDMKEQTEDPVEEKSNPVQTPDAPQFNLLAEFDDIDEDNTLCADDTREEPADDCNSEKSVSLFDNIQQDTGTGELQEDQLTDLKSETEPVQTTESEDDEEDTLTPSLEFGASEGSVDILAMKPYQLQDPTYAQSSSSGPSSIADFDFLGDDPEIKCVPESPPARQLRRGKRKVAELQSDSDGSFGSEQDVRRSKRRTTNRNKNH